MDKTPTHAQSACVGVLSIIELKNARWNNEIQHLVLRYITGMTLLQISNV